MGEEDFARIGPKVLAEHIARFTLAALGLAEPLTA
jgi:hypothetical protein